MNRSLGLSAMEELLYDILSLLPHRLLKKCQTLRRAKNRLEHGDGRWLEQRNPAPTATFGGATARPNYK